MNFNAKTPAFPTVNPHAENFDDFGNDRLFDRLAQKFKPKPYFKQYRIFCLLYTSPSPRDRTRSRMPSSA